jgi:LmbE family N-acetylglucosaminyl deacetylase
VVKALPGKRIVVVSPHLDDGVLSLGAAMASWARAGARVELLSVLACDPASNARAGGWDARAAHATEGESARRRREEDARACALLGATPVWLPFGSVDYERHGSDDEVAAAVTEAVGDADAALLPGTPLTHPDHAWLAALVSPTQLAAARVAEYAEQPYLRRSGERPSPRYRPIRVGARDRVAKWRAIRCYRSQLPLLALRGLRRGPHTLLGAEHIARVR